MMASGRTKARITVYVIIGAVLSLGIGAWLLQQRIGSLEAAITPNPCPGNVCTGTLVVGGQAVRYAYTQHISPSGILRIRLNGGAYDTSQMVSFIVFDAPQFASWDSYANPTNGAVLLPQEDVNPGRTAYERRSDSDGCKLCIIDQVMELSYSGLSEGVHTFSLNVTQNGDSGGRTGLEFYVDTGAPPNNDESVVWGSIPNMDSPCADGIDNDLNFFADCADRACAGLIGDVGSGAFCEILEATCYDEFDNDADGLIDCLDLNCDERTGRQTPLAFCQFGNESGLSSCGDLFDNDGDRLTDCLDNIFDASGTEMDTCWKRTDYGCPAVENCTTGIDDDKDRNNDDAWDAKSETGVNCRDYDCAGSPECPAREHLDASGDGVDVQCFDGIDNDLDHLIDCADPDCLGVISPADPTRICLDKEFDLGQGYQYCANSFDDDGDGPKDCDDLECARQFRNCGPCPAREDLVFSACADGSDNDSDLLIDCADPDCWSTPAALYSRLGRFGDLAAGDDAYCAEIENTPALCSDGFDNDADGLIDCLDPDCDGRAGRLTPSVALCQFGNESGLSSCGDLFDNDGDGNTDCLDDGCYGSGSCEGSLSTSVCRVVPQFSSLTAFTANDPTITVDVAETDHVNTANTIRIAGSATYDSVTVIIGDNIDAAGYYPYASVTGCKIDLSGTNAGQFRFTAGDTHFVQVFNISQPVNGFDLTLSCLTPSVPNALRTYPISLSALKVPGDVAEYGDLSFNTTLFEATPPTVRSVEVEGESGGTVDIDVGDSLRFRVVASDPGSGLEATDICGCDLKIDGTSYSSPDGNCIIDPQTSPYMPTIDDTPALLAQAEDGANNFSSTFSPSVTINVTPSVSEELKITPSKPFFKVGKLDITINAEFKSSLTLGDLFFPIPSAPPPSCDVHIFNSAGTDIGLGVPLYSFAGTPLALDRVDCQNAFTIPGGGSLTDGEYFLTVRVKDGAGDVAESRKAVIYMCNSVPSAGELPESVCAKADFDNDGAAEGLYTILYSTAPKACDNCVGLYNASQTDNNANGVGDSCEPKNPEFGRCEYERSLVCTCDSNAEKCPGAPPDVPPLPCPKFDHDGLGETSPIEQQCIFSWGLCTMGGELCFKDTECLGGPGPDGAGVCSGETEVYCHSDSDCEAAEVDGPCLNADKCENLLLPWLQTVQGNIFSKKKVIGQDLPPPGQYNATFCITAKDTIVNFLSEKCDAFPHVTLQYERPTRANSFASVLGRIDVAGLLAGRYGDTVTLLSSAGNISGPLDGKVYVIDNQDVTIGSPMTILSGNTTQDGHGTIIINGGDLIITKNIVYDDNTVIELDRVASIAWIVLEDERGKKGNIYIDKEVTEIVGVFYAEGAQGVFTIRAPDIEGKKQLVVKGLMIAKKFHWSRTYKSLTEGAERIEYDGRAVMNPPPGLGDLSKTLPLFRDSAF